MIHLEGYASIFNNKDKKLDIINPNTFTKNTKNFTPIPLLWQHKKNKIIGTVIRAHQDKKGLYIKAQISEKTPYGAIAIHKIQNQEYFLSIGYIPLDTTIDQNTRYINSAELIEISIVSNPANPMAKIIKIY